MAWHGMASHSTRTAREMRVVSMCRVVVLQIIICLRC